MVQESEEASLQSEDFEEARLAELESALVQQRRSLERLRLVFTVAHPQVRRVLRDIAELESRRDKLSAGKSEPENEAESTL